ASNNQIECFDNNKYLFYTQIEEIIINNNKIKIMPVSLFTQIYIKWDLSYNLIEMFSDYHDLEPINSQNNIVNSVNISFNNLDSLPLKAFTSVKIESLILSNNKISSFTDFATLQVIEVLDLSNNEITNIPFETFADSDVKSLLLNNNRIQLFNGIFPRNIEMIDLRFNSLRIYKPCKSDCFYVKSVNISFNNLDSLPLKAFTSVKIESLILSNNKISSFTDFATLQVIEVLDLSNNEITNIPFETFADSDVKSLLLNNNRIQLFNGIFPRNIEMIDLRFNSLRIYSAYFWYYKNLHTIFLDNNQHLELTFDDLQYSNIKTIGITSNNFA
ncbi:unnamed protein product, partial [Diamesa hyperborea]